MIDSHLLGELEDDRLDTGGVGRGMSYEHAQTSRDSLRTSSCYASFARLFRHVVFSLDRHTHTHE